MSATPGQPPVWQAPHGADQQEPIRPGVAPRGPNSWSPPAWAPPTGPVSFAPQGAPARRRRRVLGIAMVAVPALVVVAGASSIITLAVSGHSHTSTAASGQAASSSSTRHTTVGTLTAQHGMSWELRTAAGAVLTVHLRSSTAFGTRTHPSTVSAFHTGSTVRVLGAQHGTAVDASRIVGVTSGSST